MNKKYPPISELFDLFKYDSETGNIFWIAKGRGKIKKKAAGTIESNGYKSIMLNGKRIRSHKIAWAMYYGKWPEKQIDHINGIKSDNRILNIRLATNSQNGKNLKIKSNNKSGCSGVTFDKVNNKWRAHIRVNYKQIHIGRYDSFDDAVCARKNAEIKYYGEWRRK